VKGNEVLIISVGWDEVAFEPTSPSFIKAIRKIDPVFTPRKLNPDDAKVIFHPIDYIVFNGMKAPEPIKNIILLDRQAIGTDHRALQKSIEKVVEHENYEWQTLRVQEDGKIKVE